MKLPLNLLFLHSSSDLYGASKILVAVTSLCQQKGHTVVVVVSHEGPLVTRLRENGIEVILIPLGILRRKYINISGILNRLSVNGQAYGKLKQLCLERRIDLIYSNTTGVIIGSFVARSLRIRHIWHVHEIIQRPFILFRAISWMLNRKGNETLVVSEAVKKHWSRYVDPTRITVLYNGVDYDLFADKKSTFRQELGISPDRVVLGMVGRVHFWKGQDYFLKIAGVLTKQFPQLAFVLVGDPFPGYEYLYGEMDKIMDENGIRENVYLCGYREDIGNIFNAFDIFILPSILPDPAPAVVTEAMAASKAVVVTEQGGAVEMIVNNESGILIPLNNPQLAAEKIAPLIQNSELRKEIGANAHERIIQYFSREVFNEAIVAYIETSRR